VRKRLLQAGVVLILGVVAAQFIRPNRTNPPLDPTRTIEAHFGGPSPVVAVLDRSCRDCHTNATVWPGYAEVAPLSWLMAYAVAEGRAAVNFSEWSTYSAERQRQLLDLSCADANNGKMPGVYAQIRPETRLSPGDVEVICTAARQAGDRAAAAVPH
jgi:hypothetical protein